MKNNKLLFFTKNDIPFESAKLIIHTPSINELGLIGEECLRIACQVILNLPSIIKSQDNFNSEDISDFDIFIEVLNQKESKEALDYRINILKFFNLLFPNGKILIRQKDIQIVQNFGEEQTIAFIDKINFEEFKEILKQMFYNGDGSSQDYNPADGMAKKIADKLRKGKAKASANSDLKDISVYKRYASILSIGLCLDLNTVLDYSIVQVENQFKRFILHQQWKTNLDARMAGATGLDDPEDWMQEI